MGSDGLPPTLARLSSMIEAFLVTHYSEEKAEEISVKSKDNKAKFDSSGSASPRFMKIQASSSSLISSSTSKLTATEKSSSIEAVRLSVIYQSDLDERVAFFVELHVSINSLLRANAGLLELSFKGDLRHAHAIDFDNKKAYFRNVL